MSEFPAQLSYEAPRARRKWVGPIALMLAGIALALVGFHFWPVAKLRLRTFYWQRQAMSYHASPDQIVLEAGQQQRIISFGDAADSVAFYHGRVLEDGTPAPVGRDPRAWRETKSLLSMPLVGDRALAFLHERHVAGGKSRIVAVEMGYRHIAAGYWQLVAAVIVIEPGSLGSPLRVIGESITDCDNSFGPEIDNRVYAGQIDAADASHFTVSWGNPECSFVMDGYLQPDDRVRLQVHPTAPTAIKNAIDR
ncbi:MAG TPA: hypothetical protein VFE47_31680 [Tepidisphaeraceae bacterium]|jgi:hypothetical protein|nr:hypothetical protein [Tepidisphaeraceae bacterium]